MNTMEAILTRRSVRRYTDQKVEPETVEQLLKAAMYAPSAHDSRDWQFIVLRDAAVRENIAALLPWYKPIERAPVCILVCGEPSVQESSHKDYFVQDCSAATQNLMLCAHELGLGTCWCGLYPQTDVMDAVRKILGIPAAVVPFAFIAVGYPAKTYGMPERFDPKKIHMEKW
ncbi:MAG: nitroreductase family protein [Bacillota bacterium]